MLHENKFHHNKIGTTIAVIAVLLAIFTEGVGVVAAQTANAFYVKLPFGVIRDRKDTLHLLLDTTVEDRFKGLVCAVSATSNNNSSVHPNSNIIVKSASEVTLYDVESKPGNTVISDGDITLNNTIKVYLQLGEDDVFSGGLTLKFDCTLPITPTPTSTSTPTPTNTPVPTPTITSTPEPTPTSTPEPTSTPTPTPTDILTPTPTKEEKVLPAVDVLPETGSGYATMGMLAGLITAAGAGLAEYLKRTPLQ